MECIATIAQPAKVTLGFLWEHANSLFIFLFVFRYLRFLVHLVSYFLCCPSPVPEQPWLTENDVTVVIPTCAPEDPAFRRCVESIAHNQPFGIRIVTVGEKQSNQAYSAIYHLIQGFPNIDFRLFDVPEANKRRQVAEALKWVETPITVLADDHVLWPSSRFLQAALAPFDEASCGGVGTKKRVIRHQDTGIWQGFWNVMGALYLERHNFEHTASNAIDGGVAVISGRTCLYRTRILQTPEFLAGYLDEKFFFGRFGPLNADDDNYITRHLVKQGWKIKFQNTEEATILCEVDRSIYRSQPWTVYALMISQMINFALVYDLGLIFMLTRTDFYTKENVTALCLWILLSKLPKLLPYFWRHPLDVLYLPACYLFAYFHSFIKLWALLTFWDVQWSGRKLDDINAAAAEDNTEDKPDSAPEYDDTQSIVVSASKSRSGASSRATSSSRATARPVSTPWGFVAAVNLHNTPANVLQTQIAGRSWPADFSLRRRNGYQSIGYTGDDSPKALEFEDSLAAQEAYLTPMSRPRSGSYEATRPRGTPSKKVIYSILPTPPRTPPPFRELSTPSRTTKVSTRSWVRVDPCDRLHESYYGPRRQCDLFDWRDGRVSRI